MKDFCELTFGLDLPMTEITQVRGRGRASVLPLARAEHGVRPALELRQGADRRRRARSSRTWGRRRRPDVGDDHRRGSRRCCRNDGARPRFIGSRDLPRVELRRDGIRCACRGCSTVMDLARAMGWLPPGRYVTSPRAKPAALTAWHTPAYVAALEAAEARGAVSEDGARAPRARHRRPTRSSPRCSAARRPPPAASILAGELLAGRRASSTLRRAARITAFPTAPAGFCYFNDPVLAILSLRRAGRAPDRLCRHRRASSATGWSMPSPAIPTCC